jgi:site-specific DNA recombinase
MRDGRTVGSQPVRCAIYTRKSTEEGLEQDFNSLDAQREACAAYILSQRHEGWTALPEVFKDGGYSGGNMERPGMKRMMAAVAAGEIDVIVVYKVDRLTRSLADFAKIVEVLDAKSASFVSVTQSFNTTSSMGRLTLNVLLSFAQFEREVTGERIRDKIAASKAKGMWMGGPPPLGYDVTDRELVINPAEAEIVRYIFRRYVELKSAMALIADLNDRGSRSKARVGRDGRAYGGAAIGRGALYAMLRNRLYVGEVVHNGQRYPGRHQPILDAELFERAQEVLAQNKVEHRRGTRHRLPSLLSGLLWDGLGRRMSPSQSSKALVRYRYYTSQHATADDVAAQKWRLSAPDIEGRIIEVIKTQLDQAVRARIESRDLTSDAIERLRDNSIDIARQLDQAVPHDRRELVRRLVSRIIVERDRLVVALTLVNADPALPPEPAIVTLPITSVRVGSALKLLLPPAGPCPNDARTKPALVKLVAQAMAVRETMEQGRFATMDSLAEASGYGREHAMDLLRIAYLSPDITAAILEGRQPDDLTRSKLIRWPAVPLMWGEQRGALGFV